MHGTQEIRARIKKHSPDAYHTRPTATTLHNHNTNIALGSVTILKSKPAPKSANKQVHYYSMHVDPHKGKYAKKKYAHKKTSSQKGTPTNLYATRATPYVAILDQHRRKTRYVPNGRRKHFCAVYAKKMGNAPKWNAPNWHRAKLKRAELGPRQNETRQTGMRQTD